MTCWVDLFVSWWTCEFASLYVDEFMYSGFVVFSCVYKPVSWFVLYFVYERSARQVNSPAYELTKVEQLTKASTHELTNSQTHKLENLNLYLLFYNNAQIYTPF